MKMWHLPEIQEAPGGQCCPVCMCKSEEGMDTWPHLSEKEDRRHTSEKFSCRHSDPCECCDGNQGDGGSATIRVTTRHPEHVMMDQCLVLGDQMETSKTRCNDLENTAVIDMMYANYR